MHRLYSKNSEMFNNLPLPGKPSLHMYAMIMMQTKISAHPPGTDCYLRDNILQKQAEPVDKCLMHRCQTLKMNRV